MAAILEFDASPVSRDSAQTVHFLRRFADVMSGGRNADRLRHAAEAIEELADRVVDAEQQLHEEASRSASYRNSCTAAELAIADLRTEIAALEQRLGAELQQHQNARASLVEENERLTTRAEQAESKLAERSEELTRLHTGLAGLGDTLLVVPAATIRMARDQFQSLATECEDSGNMIAAVMCEVGSCLLEQAIAGSTPEQVLGE